ncbi:MAG: hypothetical protein QOG33_2576 [Gaiellales bacterium]|jgi:hypothetical protein|nr:hypothetical protein [Gaiellales bacterium]
MAGNNVDEFCKRANVDPDDLSDAEKGLLIALDPSELNALIHIHKTGISLKPIARVGSSGF